MKANHVIDRELVKICMQELILAAGVPAGVEPVQRDLEFLVESIEGKTGVSISLSTIKRLHNGQFNRIPQIATLNAIALFLDYKNWQELKTQKQTNIPETAPPVVPGNLVSPKARRFLPKSKFTITALLLLLFAVSGWFFAKNMTVNEGVSDATFSAQKTSKNEIPNTVVFKYNVDAIDADSFFIQQSWDRARRVKIFKNQYTLTDIYYEPGYHTAKLIADDKIIKTLDVSIPTDRWFMYAKQKIDKSIPKYIDTKNSLKNGSLQMSREKIVESQVDVSQEHEYIAVFFPSEIKYNSDNYILKCRIRVKPLTNNFCSNFTCEVFCQKNFMFFDATSKGCVSEIRAQFGENYLSGKTHDFSSLGIDVTNWNDVILAVKNRKVNILLNNKLVFSGSYDTASGKITGLGFISNGAFEIDFVTLKTLDGKVIYEDDFR